MEPTLGVGARDLFCLNSLARNGGTWETYQPHRGLGFFGHLLGPLYEFGLGGGGVGLGGAPSPRELEVGRRRMAVGVVVVRCRSNSLPSLRCALACVEGPMVRCRDGVALRGSNNPALLRYASMLRVLYF